MSDNNDNNDGKPIEGNEPRKLKQIKMPKGRKATQAKSDAQDLSDQKGMKSSLHSELQAGRQGHEGAQSGAGMDRQVTKKKTWLPKWAAYALVLVIGSYFIYDMMAGSGGRSLKVNEDRIVISEVQSGIFEDFYPLRGRVTPAKTVYLDAIEGGRVEKILVEDGTLLKAGDPIVILSNTSLQLNVLGNEARVAEQLNNMRSIELRLEQNRLQHKRNLTDIRYQISLLSRQVLREKELAERGNVAQSKFQDTQDTLNWYKQRLELTLESQATDTRMQEEQLSFLKATAARLESNLEISRANLDNMNVKAPVNGKLSGFDVEIGESISRGGRLGQIDTPNNYKLEADIDEFYLGRVDIDQRASFDRGGKTYDMRVSKIYPQVTNGQFRIDLSFLDRQPSNIRRGQTIQSKLTLGDSSKALMIPNGAFYQDTGGNWIFVVASDGSQAVRRQVKMGRRNNRFIEIIEGLEEGERVVTSPYTSYTQMDRLKLSK
ncbi:efflux RND transporter periplasmic adaptor subunit [Temperatibacter marinus]|uniref:Efflux RND transporter periplasmic adaptor subunit n=1 Tax=Temperatibacter marinus TaxID=1456591 RepID=A0AA52H8N8_9PROT|nr:efflux RND transporter periplasmic adaptor subunit [Temperatibacter marinus]WND01657.1 efflux RND transporter periplasmic adaptor subunit [Temperatibacter marinus]